MATERRRGVLRKKFAFGPRGIVILLRLVIFLLVFVFILYGQKTTFFTYRYFISIGLFYLLTNLFLFIIPDKFFTKSLAIIFLLDVFFISSGIYFTQGFETDLYLTYFLVIFISGLTQNPKLNILTSFVVGILYLGLFLKSQSIQALLTPWLLLRFPLIFITGLFTSFYSSEMLRSKQEIRQKTIELGTALETVRQTEEQLRQAEKLSELGLMAAGIVHELNNPLTAVLGYSQLILQELEKDDPHRQDVQKIESATLQCRKIIQGLLKFSRQEEPRFALVDINDIVEDSIDAVAHQFKFAGIGIIKNLTPNLDKIFADKNQLEEVFVNIINNAKDATPPGGTLTVSTESVKNEIKVKFADTGIGIPKEVMNKIFNPFFTTKQPGEGTGLGLSVAHGIVKKHNGRIKVESEVGKGSTFTVILPVATQS